MVSITFRPELFPQTWLSCIYCAVDYTLTRGFTLLPYGQRYCKRTIEVDQGRGRFKRNQRFLLGFGVRVGIKTMGTPLKIYDNRPVAQHVYLCLAAEVKSTSVVNYRCLTYPARRQGDFLK